MNRASPSSHIAGKRWRKQVITSRQINSKINPTDRVLELENILVLSLPIEHKIKTLQCHEIEKSPLIVN